MKALRTIILTVVLAATTFAADSKIGYVRDDTAVTILRRNAGQRVELIMKSGQRIAGKVEDLGPQTVHLSAIGGQEMFDAVVLLDDVSAVLVRTVGK